MDQPGEEGQGQQEMVIENREEQQDVIQDREELEEEVQEVGKTWEETFNRSVKNLKGERQRRMPERFRSEVSTEEGSRDRVKKQDSPKQRKRKQSLARYGGGSPSRGHRHWKSFSIDCLHDKFFPNFLRSILDTLQKSAKFSMDFDSIAAAMPLSAITIGNPSRSLNFADC